MTILVAYVPRRRRGGTRKGFGIAQRGNERLVVGELQPRGPKEDLSLANEWDISGSRRRAGRSGHRDQAIRSRNSAVTEIGNAGERTQVSLVVIGLRVRSRVGKLLLGSVARTSCCPSLSRAGGQSRLDVRWRLGGDRAGRGGDLWTICPDVDKGCAAPTQPLEMDGSRPGLEPGTSR